MTHETQALRNRIKRTESDIVKLQSEFKELLERMDKLEEKDKLKIPDKRPDLPRYERRY